MAEDALYTLQELCFIKEKIKEFRYQVEKKEKISKENFTSFCGDINLFLRRRYQQSKEAQITKEDMRRIYDLAKETLDNFANIDDYFVAFDKIFLLIVEVERSVILPKSGGPATIGI